MMMLMRMLLRILKVSFNCMKMDQLWAEGQRLGLLKKEALRTMKMGKLALYMAFHCLNHRNVF